jgi:competence protein ComEC
LAGLVAALMRRLAGPRRSLWLTLGVIALYTLLVGASASVVRAAIMGSLALVAQRLGRSAQGLGGLALAAWLMTLWNPLTLWDVGFQLSAAATLGLVLYADRLEAGFTRLAAHWTSPSKAKQAAALAAELVLLTLAAQITTLPLIIFHFRQLSVISLAANLLVLPVQPAVMVISGVALALGLVWLPLGQVAAWLAWPAVAFTINVVEALARVPGAAVALGDTAPVLLAITYLLLFGGTQLLARPAAQQPRWWTAFAPQRKAAGGLALLSLTTLVAWSWYFSLPPNDGRLRVTLLNLSAPAESPGGGEALLVQTPSGHTLLIGGGPGALTLARALDRTLPLFTRTLDVLVIAAPGSDHLGALAETLDRYTLARVVLTRAAGGSTAYRVLVDALNTSRVDVLDAGTLPVIDLGDGVRLRVLADTAHGSLLRLEDGRFSLIAAPGLTAEEAAEFTALGLAQPATALLLAHSGADAANSAAWVQAINPQVVLIAAQPGSGPAPELLGRLAGRAVLRTDTDGAVTVMSDGTQLWVETER